MNLLKTLIFATALASPTIAAAGQITLWNASGATVEVRAVRKGAVAIPNGEARTFLYPAENGDFRVWSAETKCDYLFPFEASEDATLQFDKGPALSRLPADAKTPLAGDALRAAQPKGWPLSTPDKQCD